MKLNRNMTYRVRVQTDDDDFAKISPAERISFMWKLAAELWSLKKSRYVKQRLQRDVTKLIRKEG